MGFSNHKEATRRTRPLLRAEEEKPSDLVKSDEAATPSTCRPGRPATPCPVPACGSRPPARPTTLPTYSSSDVAFRQPLPAHPIVRPVSVSSDSDPLARSHCSATSGLTPPCGQLLEPSPPPSAATPLLWSPPPPPTQGFLEAVCSGDLKSLRSRCFR